MFEKKTNISIMEDPRFTDRQTDGKMMGKITWAFS